ncbi:MAG TPA: hypothetical protein PLB91_08220 [Spirochaetales bacterium]|nr:hypothetical protein [Spirochaetales bacterium]HRZ63276.1 hypothetical protein [Spirochaetia bacterium]
MKKLWVLIAVLSCAATALGAAELSLPKAKRTAHILSIGNAKLFVGYAGGELACFDITSGTLQALAKAGGAPIRKLALSPDGSRLAAGDADGMVWVFDAASLKRLAKLKASSKKNAVSALAYSLDGSYLAASTADDASCVIVFETGQAYKDYLRFPKLTSKDQAWLASPQGDFAMLQRGFSPLAFTKGGTLLANRYASWLREFGVAAGIGKGTVLRDRIQTKGYAGLAYLAGPDALLAITKMKGSLFAYQSIALDSLEPREEPRELAIPGEGIELGYDYEYAVSPEGAQVLVNLRKPEGSSLIISLERGEVAARVPADYLYVAFSPDGKLAAYADKAAKAIVLLDLASGAETARVTIER